MEELRRRIGKVWRACNSPSRKNSPSNMFWLVQTWSKLFPPVPTCSHLFSPVYNCSQQFTLVHTCSHLFTPVHISVTITLFTQWQFLVEFSPCESCYFAILRAILLKLHIFAHLIESYPMVHDFSSCIEIIMSIPLAAHTTVTMYACWKMSFFAVSKALIPQSYFVYYWNSIIFTISRPGSFFAPSARGHIVPLLKTMLLLY